MEEIQICGTCRGLWLSPVSWHLEATILTAFTFSFTPDLVWGYRYSSRTPREREETASSYLHGDSLLWSLPYSVFISYLWTSPLIRIAFGICSNQIFTHVEMCWGGEGDHTLWFASCICSSVFLLYISQWKLIANYPNISMIIFQALL